MRTLTIFLISLFSLPLVLNAQSVDEMLQKVSAAIEAGQNGQAVSYFRQTIALNIDRTEMYYWTNVDKNSEISSKLATELALAYKKNRNYDKAYLFYKELLQKAPNNVDCLEACAEMQVCRGQEKDALRMYEKILQLEADNLAANIFLFSHVTQTRVSVSDINFCKEGLKMKKIGFIGAGNMATAIIKGLMAQNDGKADFINVFDVSEEKCAAMKNMGANVMTSADEIAKNSSIVVLAVKPQNYPEVLESLKNSITTAKTVVSIAAGISIAYVRKGLECDCPVVRVMPNTPLLLKKGATALCPSENISDDDKTIVYNMFAGSGVCEYIDESHMNEIIAVNGSSPAYIYLFAKAMADYAKNCGIEYDKAMNLVCATLEGSAAMLRDSGEPVETLIDRVCSKGGTTIAAMDKLKEHGFYEAVLDGMDACTKRAEELGK